MSQGKKKIDAKLQTWIDAQKRHRLTNTQVQMARELGMNPKKLGKLDNHRQEPWKMPLPDFIEHRYVKRFGKKRPDEVVSFDDKIRRDAAKKQKRGAEKAQSEDSQEEIPF